MTWSVGWSGRKLTANLALPWGCTWVGIFAPLADIVISKLPSPASLASTTQNNDIEY
jgi:hypothetical protein